MSSHLSRRWSEWAWDDQNERWFRERIDRHGRLQQEHSYPEQQVPRTPDPEDNAQQQLAQELAQLNVGGGEQPVHGFGQQPATGYEGQTLGTSFDEPTYVLDPNGGGEGASAEPAAEAQSRHRSKGKNPDRSKSSHKPGRSGHDKRGKGRSRSYHEEDDVQRHEPFFTKSSVDGGDQENFSGQYPPQYQAGQPAFPGDVEGTNPTAGGHEGHMQAQAFHGQLEDPHGGGGFAEAIAGAPGAQHRGRRSRHVSFQNVVADDANEDLDDLDDDDAELQAAMVASRQANIAANMPGQASTNRAYYDGRGEYVAQSYDTEGYAIPQNYEEAFGDPNDEEAGDDDGAQVSDDEEGAIQVRLDTSGLEGNIEPLDPRYKIEHSVAFQPGNVFKVLWSEPAGQNARGYTEQRSFMNSFGEKFYVGIRRFIIIRGDMGHCTCVPILTYGKQACLKKGVKPSKHGIVYQDKHKPKPVRGEPRLGFPPVRMVMTAPGEKLAWRSRANYSKLVTIEHNTKVYFIGYIHEPDFNIVADAVDECWLAKNFKHGGGAP